MALEKFTILIAGSAFHTPDSYLKLVKALELAGYEVHIPALPTGNGTRPPTADLTTDSQLIRGYAESLISAGRRVVVIEHSGHGGNKSKQFGNMDLIPLAFDIDEDKTAALRDPKTAFVDQSIDEEEVEVFLKTLVRWNLHGLFQPIEHAAWREISPVAYIYTEDMLVPIHHQRNIVECVEKEGVKVQTFELKTGHFPQTSDPQGIEDIFTHVVSGLEV